LFVHNRVLDAPALSFGVLIVRALQHSIKRRRYVT